MLRRRVLAALDAGIATGDDDDARAALARIDWILRGPARRRLERALIDAALDTGELGSGDAETTRRVQRVAALAVRGEPTPAPGDRAAVATAYAATPAPAALRAPIATVVGAVLALGAISGATAYLATRPGPPPRRYTKPQLPASPTAFRDGGVPLRDPAIEAALAGPLPDLVIAADHDAADRTQRAATLRAEPAFAAHGAPVARAWAALLDDLDRWPERAAGPMAHAAGDVLRVSARNLSDRLATAGLGYLVEADALFGGGPAQAALYVYRVEEVVFVRRWRATPGRQPAPHRSPQPRAHRARDAVRRARRPDAASRADRSARRDPGDARAGHRRAIPARRSRARATAASTRARIRRIRRKRAR